MLELGTWIITRMRNWSKSITKIVKYMEQDTKPRIKKYRRTQAVALKRISNDMIKILEKVKNKKYTEREIEEAIHKAKVMEKKRQIMLSKFDSDWDKLVAYQVRDMVVTHNKNKVYISIGNILRQLLP